MDRLYFIYMSGCPVCTLVKPIVRAFRDSRPDVKVVSFDVTAVEWRAKKWIPSVTPTLVRLNPQGQVTIFEGRAHEEGGRVIDPREVQQWLSSNF